MRTRPFFHIRQTLQTVFCAGLLILSYVASAQCVLTVSPTSPVPSDQGLSFALTCGGVPVKTSDSYIMQDPPGISTGSGWFSLPNAFGLSNSGAPAGSLQPVVPGIYTFQAYQCVAAGGNQKPTQAFCQNGASNLVAVGASQSVTVVAASSTLSAALTSPINGSTSAAFDPINLTTDATSPSSPITKVDYFADNTRIGSATTLTPPFSFTWRPTLPNSYKLSVVVTNQAGLTTTSKAVAVLVTPPKPPTLICDAIATPASIKTNDSVKISASCQRNGIALSPATLANFETLSYTWSAVGASPLVPAGATSDTLTLPAKTFDKAGRYVYQVQAKITNSQFPSAFATSNLASATVNVTASVTNISVTSNVDSLKIRPGENVSFTFAVTDGVAPVKNQVVLWSIVGGNVKRATTKGGSQKAFANCVAQDLPEPAPITTDDKGEGTISFTAGCATGGRTILLSAGGFLKDILLKGPDQLASSVTLLNGVSLISAEPGKPTPVSVRVVDANNVNVVSTTTKWTIEPASAGTISATAISNADGIATATLTLGANVTIAQLEACIDGNRTTCKKIQVRNSITAIATPAAALLQPTIQQAIDAPRVQLNNIRNRLQQLRVEESPRGSGGKDGGGSDKSSSSDTKKSDFGVFAVGEVEIAKRQSTSGETNYKLRTKGVTVGADYRMQKNLIVGAAFGALVGDSTLTGGSQKTMGYSASVFGQWLPSDNWYINSIVNVGKNRIDNRRTSILGESLTGRGTTTQQAFQVEAGYGFSKDGARFTPFVRYEMIRAKLKPFEETGGADALAISGQTVRANAVGAGVIAEYAISTSSGVWIPSGRVEFLSESQKQDAAFARLVNGTPLLVPVTAEAIDKNFGTWGLNLQWLAGPGGNLVSSFVGYEQTFAKAGFKNDRVTAGVKIPF